jgi:hypothetical protein
MFAVFAAVAAVGSSIVLGVGFERLRAGFEIVRKQTGFFADAIHKLDERTKEISAENGKLKEAVSFVTDRVERVEKTTGFFSDAIHSLEQKILEGSPAQQAAVKDDHSELGEPILPRDLDWITTNGDDIKESNTDYLLQTLHTLSVPSASAKEAQSAAEEPSETRASGLPNLLMSYFRTETRGGKEIVYH